MSRIFALHLYLQAKGIVQCALNSEKVSYLFFMQYFKTHQLQKSRSLSAQLLSPRRTWLTARFSTINCKLLYVLKSMNITYSELDPWEQAWKETSWIWIISPFVLPEAVFRLAIAKVKCKGVKCQIMPKIIFITFILWKYAETDKIVSISLSCDTLTLIWFKTNLAVEGGL